MKKIENVFFRSIFRTQKLKMYFLDLFLEHKNFEKNPPLLG